MSRTGIRTMLAMALLVCAAGLHAADNKADPLAKFSDEDLIKVDFCFNKICEAVTAKDAKLVAAFVDELPKNLSKYDLSKPADRTEFLKAFAVFDGAQIVSSMRIPIGGLAEITYTDKSGAEKKQRMQNIGGRWKLTGL